MKLYCCGCTKDVEPRITSGKEIYPHRPDLAALPFWKCDVCGNHVGCHHKTNNRTAPLGCIPTPKLREARGLIHTLLDPIWMQRKMNRKQLYAEISDRIGWKFHTAKIRTLEEARTAYRIIREIANERGVQ